MLQFDNQYFNPHVAALYPFLMRMIHRGDVAESPVVAKRPAHLPSVLNNASLSFLDRSVTELGLTTKFAVDRSNASITNIHRRTPAVAKCVVEWTTNFEATAVFPIENYRGTVDTNTYWDAATGQLTWQEGLDETDGLILINTPGTQGALGFFDQDDIVDLANVKIQFLKPGRQFATVCVTAKNPGQTLADADELLVLGVARARNTGMQYDATGKVTSAGTGPVLMEPVQAKVWIKRAGPIAVNKLDHDGLLGAALNADSTNKCFTIDGATDQTPFYKVTVGPAVTNIVVNGAFTAPLLKTNTYWIGNAAANLGWLVHSKNTKFVISSETLTIATRGGYNAVSQILTAGGVTGNVPFSVRAKNSVAGGTTWLKVWGCNGVFKLQTTDATGPKNNANQEIGVLLHYVDISGSVYDWTTFSGTLNLGATGYDYLILKIYSTGGSGTTAFDDVVLEVPTGG